MLIDDAYLDTLFHAIAEAHREVRPQVAVTPLAHSFGLSAKSGCQVYLKCEHLQHTGSFKYRGASNKLRLLEATQRGKGVVAASSGNHGQGLALAGQALGIPVTVYTTSDASPYKIDAMRALGADVRTLEMDSLGAELEGARQALQQGKPFVSPYNDPEIIAGQGTIGMELFEQMPDLAAVFVAVGGGGLISGIGAALHRLAPSVDVIGCWPANAPTLQRSLEEGRIIEMEEAPTISDGTAGGVEPGSITLPLCQRLLKGTVLVSEQEIRDAMRDVAATERWIIEGAAGVAMAGMQKMADAYRGKKVAVVLCGRNIVLEKYLEAIA
ncbi:threonine/serine dehydratase [Pseudomonas putida]|uniref:threonine/serine dehydratase n=1 Tax=Pseudomonas sp. p1(2021b) TaxID=2874628 RepID=UPI001CC8F2DE|nr:threonine/serine dehydratase [Pseudomonas sp. p1(2021b)]EKT4523952.1 threonine/serine dehydratase [Pseudomonas putida]UBM24923.1 threonine/serine dehydratase [Pseudomonas sp. p1(2021b)]